MQTFSDSAKGTMERFKIRDWMEG